MPRLSFLALITVALVSLIQANPLSQQQSLQPGGSTARTTESWDYVDCGLPTDPVQIQSIEVSPDPPQPGQDLTVKVNATVTEIVEEGAFANVVVKLGLIKLLQKRFDVCEEARNVNATVQCPVQPGTYEVQQTVALPKEIPKAKFTISVRGFTVEEEDLVCLDLKVDFMKHPFPKFGW